MEKIKIILRLCWFTFAWCTFVPLFFIKNNGEKIIQKGAGSSGLLVACFFVGGKQTTKRLWLLLKKGRVLSAWQLFWAKWNPIITTETSRPLYQLCGGQKRPFLASMVVFLYSGLFLHGYSFPLTLYCVCEMISGNNLAFLSHFPLFSVSFWLIIGLPVAIANSMRMYKIKSKKEERRMDYSQRSSKIAVAC